MLKDLLNALGLRKRLDEEELFALSWKIPSELEILITKTDTGYFAKITSFKDDNVVTQADTGQELVTMINDALYEYLDIPTEYMESLGFFMPPENVRDELKVSIPNKYLNTAIGLQRA